MAIQNRRGSYSDFAGGANLVDGEFGMVQSGDTNTTDGTGVYAAPVAGTVHRLLTDDDKTEMTGDIAQNTQDIAQNTQDIGTLNTSLSNFIALFSANPTVPSSYNSMATNINQGYIKVGKVVFVSVYFEAVNNIGAIGSQVLQGFPRPIGSRNLQAMNLDTNAMVFAYVNTSGQVAVGQVSAGNRIVVEGVYFARS